MRQPVRRGRNDKGADDAAGVSFHQRKSPAGAGLNVSTQGGTAARWRRCGARGLC